jgi:hypothetical protein
MGTYAIRDIKLVNILDRAEKDMQQFKGSQPAGNRVLKTKTTWAGELLQSMDLWGVGQPSTDPPAQNFVYQNVTFKADRQKSPYGRLIFELYKADKTTKITLGSEAGVFYYNFTVTEVDDGLMKWGIDIRGPGATKFYVRLGVAATDSGTITAEYAGG